MYLTDNVYYINNLIMSMFTKRRKIVRQKQEEDRKRWEENIEKQQKAMNNIIKTAKIIEQTHPEFESLTGDERVELFGKIFNEVTKD